MDNDLIKIDDLVRQRLTGGEERERSGAWLRMKDLLDQEEGRKPVGFIWRRMFGGLAALILIASISLGGYEIAATSRKPMASNNMVAGSPIPANASQGHTPDANTSDARSGNAYGSSTSSRKTMASNNMVAVSPIPANASQGHTPDANTSGARSGNAYESSTSSRKPMASNNMVAVSPIPTNASQGHTPDANTSGARSGNAYASSTSGATRSSVHSHPVASASIGNEVVPRTSGSDNENTTNSNRPLAHKTASSGNRSILISKHIANGNVSSENRNNRDDKSNMASASPAGKNHNAAHHNNTTGDNKNSVTGKKLFAASNTGNPAIHTAKPGHARDNAADGQMAGSSKTASASVNIPVAGSNTLSHKRLAANKAGVTGTQTSSMGTKHQVLMASATTGHIPAAAKSTTGMHIAVAANGDKASSADASEAMPTGNDAATGKTATGSELVKTTATHSDRHSRIGNPKSGIARITDAKSGSHKASTIGSAIAGKSATTNSSALPGHNSPHKAAISGARAGTANGTASSASRVAHTSPVAGSKAGTTATDTKKMAIGAALSSKTTTARPVTTSAAAVAVLKPSVNGPSAASSTTGRKAHVPVTARTNEPANPVANLSASPVSHGTKTATGNTASSRQMPGPALPTLKGKRVVEKITVSEVLVRTPQNTYVVHIDTVRIESVTEEYDIAASDGYVFGPPVSVEAIDSNSASSTGNAKPVLAAAANAAKNTVGKNESEKNKGKGGGAGLASIQSAFNDIKYKINGSQFAMGLTGGINGTFFGPNSFKGFQFGFTGNVIFSESFNILVELKYMHRINNNYTLNDNYYTYTPSGAGYSRQLMLNPYSLSTLHSFEMPLIVRYSMGKFNFFAGGNLVYSFAINEAGGVATPDPNNVTYSPVIGNDQAPKIQANDFASRFGLGYLFGVGVQLSPVLSMDIRDVQTFWDNSQTTGSKEISNQLYRSPSFQVSLGYRFSGRKGKDK